MKLRYVGETTIDIPVLNATVSKGDVVEAEGQIAEGLAVRSDFESVEKASKVPTPQPKES